MALSMEEQRILAEIETRLRRDDPHLAARLSTLGRSHRLRRSVLVMAAVVVVAAAAAVAVAVL
ncbi:MULTISPECIES: DUF3040 domain-containing protein [Thermomonospora]|uniref:DUF3040 domain-containing protein n=1 Tax=Thermomonospora curvata (strain ATCC 19995 / DSM 43183 / JCM 3096 / KCTC 9072 / NBRC 15933 / NCIMB 10081 / Henssen B9) TaxID=471852 RepID=D1A3Q6_THECD|nr:MULTISPECIES: DUF3040 domain-containing protein [Thermomonospora]ACY97959.1 hypothetical protein Tcur_2395 [Thermomonospora curvata DSM 43183]PKK14239.1 MAG: DUF3040 domain-containing protein [Thermomonospora sp. CIF 1]